MPADRAFLGVESSVTGRKWRDRLDEAGQARALAIAQHSGLSDLMSRILAGRDVAPDEAENFLDPTLRGLLPDPFALTAMEAATARLVAAILRRETVAIFGDYDVDGACSSALLAEFLDHCGTPRLLHIPDRITEGYGPNVEAIRALASQGAKLLVTVDCGTTSQKPFEAAKALGLDAIVLDHHQAPEHLPDALVVNPNRQDDMSGQGALCAAGVVFLTLVAVNRALRDSGFWREYPEPDLLLATDLVALATVADVAPLTGLNRAFVVKGLALMKARGRPGLRALADIAGVNGPPRAWHLGFLLGPRINAGGRIGDAALGARLLLERDDLQAGLIAAELDRLNGERQLLEKSMVEQALAQAELTLAPDACAVIAGGEDWQPGIVGLVAARLKEACQRPAFALAFAGDVATGSARSIPGVDLGKAVRAAVERGLLEKGGGHAMAAGVTLKRERLEAFRAFIEATLAEPVARARKNAGLCIDGLLTAGACAPPLVEAFEKAGPFGAGNPEPVFALAEHRITEVSPFGADHLRVRVRAGDGAKLELVSFRSAQTALGQALLGQAKGARAHLACALSLDHWGGKPRVSARLVDMALA
jgi:single-stranded-DNA-specific exonuclease